MRRILSVFVAFTAVFVMSFVFVQPAAAYSGISLEVYDSKELDPWVHGGDVFVTNDSGQIVATGELGQPSGTLLLAYGTDTLGLCGGPCAAANGEMTITIDYTCTVSANCSGGPVGTPTTGGNQYTEITALPFSYNVQVTTNTGPTAITLADIGIDSSDSSSITLFGLALTLMGAFSLFALRRRFTQ